MTRETKVGLVVACSFLILVGIVVASKLRNGDDPAEQQEPNKVAAISPTPEKKEPKQTEAPKKNTPSPTFPALQGQSPDKLNKPLNSQLPSNVIASSKTEDWLKKNVEKAKEQGDGKPFLPPPAPTVQSSDNSNTLIPLVGQSDANKPLAPLDINNLPGALALNDPAKKDPAPAALPTFPPEAKKDNQSPMFPPLAPMNKEGVGTFQIPEPKKGDASSFPPLAPLKKGGEITFPPMEPKKEGPATFPPMEPKKDAVVTFPPVEPKKEGAATFPPLAPLKKDNEPSLPPVVNNPLDGPPAFPAQKKDNAIGQPNPLTLPSDFKKEPSIAPLTNSEQPIFPGTPKDNLPTIKPAPLDDGFAKKDIVPPAPLTMNQNNPPKSGLNALPTLPESPPKTIGPISAHELPSTPILSTNPNNNNPTMPTLGGNRPTPAPIEYNMNFTQTAQGESNLAQISKRLYGDAKYADALAAFNRKHGNASLNPAFLSPNQKLMYPTSPEILARDYPTLISNVASAPTIPSIPQNSPAVKLVSPAVTITPPSVPSSTPTIAAVSNPPVGQGRSYVVQSPGGERIRDIAQRALGNADRWTEIYRINQNLNLQPQFPLPAGTRLQLPAN